ncbi:MAG: hypothetical protein HKP09_01920, partial [Enterobacterales bacterium]|nr:hypothetical protein [Enterobacterales bacterium]
MTNDVTFQTDTGQIKRVLMKHAKDAFVSQEKIAREWRALNYLQAPDFNEACREYDALLTLLQSLGVNIELLPEDSRTTLDSLYTRDNAVATNEGMLLCNMGKAQRATETLSQAAFYDVQNIPHINSMPEGACLEGGDVTWLKDDVVAVGHGYRTNSAGIEFLQETVANTAREVITVPLPHFRGPSDVLHLMSMISPVADDIAVVYSPLMPVVFRDRLLDLGYQLIEVPVAEYDSLGCNVLTVSPGVCVVAEGAPMTQ